MKVFLYFQLIFLIILTFYNLIKYKKGKLKFFLGCVILNSLLSMNTVTAILRIEYPMLTQHTILSIITIWIFVLTGITTVYLILNIIQTNKRYKSSNHD